MDVRGRHLLGGAQLAQRLHAGAGAQVEDRVHRGDRRGLQEGETGRADAEDVVRAGDVLGHGGVRVREHPPVLTDDDVRADVQDETDGAGTVDGDGAGVDELRRQGGPEQLGELGGGDRVAQHEDPDETRQGRIIRGGVTHGGRLTAVEGLSGVRAQVGGDAVGREPGVGEEGGQLGGEGGEAHVGFSSVSSWSMMSDCPVSSSGRAGDSSCARRSASTAA